MVSGGIQFEEAAPFYALAMTMITVAILEGNAQTLSYLEAILTGSGIITVLGTYKSGAEALSRLPGSVPEVFLSDLNLPDMQGIEVIRKISERFDGVDILVLTVHEEKDYILPALKAGASGYLLKGTSPRQLIESVVEIRNGGSPMSPRIARVVLNEFRPKGARPAPDLLSGRECDILDGIAKGMTEKKLAETLDLSPHTVHHHIKNIYKKLHVQSRLDAVLRAREKGLL
jgi:two-component system NarL family response regulator